MTIPAGLTAVEVRGYYVRVDGSSSRGTVDLTPVVTRDSASLNLTVVAAPVRVTLDSAGRFARTVTAGDDPDLGTLYMRVDERIDGVTRTYTILVPESAAVAGLDLADAAPLVPVEPLAGYVLASSVGVTVAPLVGGLVPVVHLPTGFSEQPLPAAGVLSAPMTVGGVLTVTVTSNWGLTSAGAAYYDPDGAVAADAAIASLDSSGTLVLTRPGEASQGPIGAGTGQVGFSAVAAIALSGHRVVTPRPDGTLEYASNATAAHLHAPLWITRGAVTAGQSATVLAYGALTESSWAWTPGVPLFLGANGLLTQTAPVAPGALFSAQVGAATGPTSAFFDRQPSISLA